MKLIVKLKDNKNVRIELCNKIQQENPWNSIRREEFVATVVTLTFEDKTCKIPLYQALYNSSLDDTVVITFSQVNLECIIESNKRLISNMTEGEFIDWFSVSLKEGYDKKIARLSDRFN